MATHESHEAEDSPFITSEDRSVLTEHHRELLAVIEEVGLDLFFLNSLIGGATDENDPYRMVLTRIQHDVADRLASLICKSIEAPA
jgi:hypothetical protein